MLQCNAIWCSSWTKGVAIIPIKSEYVIVVIDTSCMLQIMSFAKWDHYTNGTIICIVMQTEIAPKVCSMEVEIHLVEV